MTKLLVAWVIGGGILGGFVQIMFAMSDTQDPISFHTAFWFVRYFYENYKDQINCAGMAIAMIFISVLVLPGSIIIVLLEMLWRLLGLAWNAFMFIFRKKKEEYK